MRGTGASHLEDITSPIRLPSRPDCIHSGSFGHLNNQRHIGIVVVVASSRHLDKLVRQLYVFGINPDVVGSGLRE